ncbi:MAG: dTDP-4-amino-4,6-dideoxygalactose transaminase [Cyanobacteria bacterium DS2.3.42]|nr:dTDP-4-amino-4,6-dideoxygalactose transaminase [Cyanobacteria bacterium DS2.3.42]
MNYVIPFNKPHFTGPELDYISQALTTGHLSGDGQFTQRCSNLLEEQLAVRKALLTTSCTHALEMAALLLDIKEGDEVILPSFTFVSTANAFMLRGAIPVFVDVRPDTFNIDEKLIEAEITDRTKAIVPVHYGGVGCQMETICSIASKHDIAIVEDNAHGLFAKYNGKYLGTFGAMATQSFHETKNFQCGEGGALLINDDKYVERAEIIREKGTDRKKFFRGQVDKYSWVDIGSSYLPSEVLSAILFAQLESRDKIQSQRKALWERYLFSLNEWASKEGIKLPQIPQGCEHSHHVFYLLMNSLEDREALTAMLKMHGILAVHHYVPLHSSKMGRQLSKKSYDLPVTNYVSDRLLRLPLYNSLTFEQQDKVIDAVRSFSSKNNSGKDRFNSTFAYQ